MTTANILERLLSNISDEFDKTVGSFFYDAEMPVAMELEQVYSRLEEIVLNGYAKTATDEWLDKTVAEQGLTRKQATFAEGFVEITGDDGAVVEVGTKIASSGCIFSTTVERTIENGVAIVPIISDEGGVIGNVPTGAINQFPVTIAGLLEVTNHEPTTGGYNAETDDELRARYFEKVTQPATSGNVYHYRQWTKEIVGVGDCRVIPLWNGNGTVKIIITDSNGDIAEQELIDEVASYIETVRPIGAEVTVVSATPKFIDISCELDGSGEHIAESITAYLKTIEFGNTAEVSYAKIGKAILSSLGVNDYENLLVNGGRENIELTDSEVAKLGQITLS